MVDQPVAPAPPVAGRINVWNEKVLEARKLNLPAPTQGTTPVAASLVKYLRRTLPGTGAFSDETWKRTEGTGLTFPGVSPKISRFVLSTGDGADDVHISLDKTQPQTDARKVFIVKVNGEAHKLVVETKDDKSTASFDDSTPAEFEGFIGLDLGNGENSLKVDEDVDLDLDVKGGIDKDSFTILGSGNTRLDAGDGENFVKVVLQGKNPNEDGKPVEVNGTQIKTGKDKDHIELYAGASSAECTVDAGDGDNEVIVGYSDNNLDYPSQATINVSTGTGDDKLTFKYKGSHEDGRIPPITRHNFRQVGVSLNDDGGKNTVSIDGGSVDLDTSSSTISGSSRDESINVTGNGNNISTLDGDDEIHIVDGINNTADGGDGDDELSIAKGKRNTLRGGSGDNSFSLSTFGPNLNEHDAVPASILETTVISEGEDTVSLSADQSTTIQGTKFVRKGPGNIQYSQRIADAYIKGYKEFKQAAMENDTRTGNTGYYLRQFEEATHRPSPGIIDGHTFITEK